MIMMTMMGISDSDVDIADLSGFASMQSAPDYQTVAREIGEETVVAVELAAELAAVEVCRVGLGELGLAVGPFAGGQRRLPGELLVPASSAQCRERRTLYYLESKERGRGR